MLDIKKHIKTEVPNIKNLKKNLTDDFYKHESIRSHNREMTQISKKRGNNLYNVQLYIEISYKCNTIVFRNLKKCLK